jgi:5-methylcytosine-specific restriction endonuclease McrA
MAAQSKERRAANPKAHKDREAKWRAANPAKVKAAKVKYRAVHPEVDKAYTERYYAANREQLTANARQRYIDNIEQEKARGAKYRAENPDKTKESTKKWRAANYQRFYTNMRKWHAANPECAERSGKAYRIANAEKARAKTIQWRKENPDKANAASRLKRARKAAAEGRHTAADIEAIWIRQGKKCAVPNCEHPISDVRGDKNIFHVDHIIPLKPKSGPAGTNWPSNLQILCWKHNTQKRNRDPQKWAEENGLEKAAPEDAA